MFTNYLLSKQIKLIISYEFERFFFKSIFINTLLPFYIRLKAYRQLILLDRRTSLSFLRLRCTITNRSRSILTFFKQSRISFRNFYSYGFLNGLRKSGR